MYAYCIMLMSNRKINFLISFDVSFMDEYDYVQFQLHTLYHNDAHFLFTYLFFSFRKIRKEKP